MSSLLANNPAIGLSTEAGPREPRWLTEPADVATITSSAVWTGPRALTLRYGIALGPIPMRPQSTATICFPAALANDVTASMGPFADHLAKHIGLLELLSYWKAACPHRVEAPDLALSPDMRRWWTDLWADGMGEFYHRNGMTIERPVIALHCGQLAAEVVEEPSVNHEEGPLLAARCLVPFTGGKDSALTAALLDRAGYDWIPFVINPNPATRRCLEWFGRSIDDAVVVTRTISPALLDLNARGAFNGHTPFSAIVAFYAYLAASVMGCRWIALSNEGSADEPTTADGVNHQYSKTLAFEHAFRAYTRMLEEVRRPEGRPPYPDASCEYFSLLRPLNEFQIVTALGAFPGLLETTASCNRRLPEGAWCGRCAKCLSTAILIAATRGRDTMRAILGTDPLDGPDLAEMFDRLTGMLPEKPFECVAERRDILTALSVIDDAVGGEPCPTLLTRWREQGKPGYQRASERTDWLRHWGDGHNLPTSFEALVRRACHLENGPQTCPPC